MGEQIADSMIITKILMTLSASYRHFVSAWESAPAGERTLENLKARVMTEESRHTSQENKSGNAFSSNAQRGKSKRSSNRGGASRASTKPGKCYVCGEAGHWARECQHRKGDDNRERPKGGNSAPERKLHGEGLVSEALTSRSSQQVRDADWFLDSGASDHMCNQIDWYVTYEAFDTQTPVCIGDGGCIEAYGKGNINIDMFNRNDWIRNHLVDVLYVPKLKYNLFSVDAALDKGLEMQSTNIACKTKDGRVIATGVRKGKMYVIKFNVNKPSMLGWRQHPPEALTTSTVTLKDWHEKLAHQNFRHVRRILDKFQIPVKNKKNPFCEACAVGKMHRLPFLETNSKTQSIREIIHADLCDLMPIKSFGGSRYYLLLKDDYSHYRTTYFIKSKAETSDCVKNFLRKAEKQCPGGVQILRTDNELEFVNDEIKQLANRLGIRQRTVIYTPEQNGSAERDNRTLKEAARTLMLRGGFKAEFWAEAINTAVNTLNWTGTSSIKGVTPHELWFQRKQDIKNLHIFGEEVFVHIPKEKCRALDAKARKDFVGYGDEIKGYRVWFPDDMRIETARNIIFFGQNLPNDRAKGT